MALKLSGRALHWVFKVGDRAKTIDFYRNVLGMKVGHIQYMYFWKLSKRVSCQLFTLLQGAAARGVRGGLRRHLQRALQRKVVQDDGRLRTGGHSLRRRAHLQLRGERERANTKLILRHLFDTTEVFIPIPRLTSTSWATTSAASPSSPPRRSPTPSTGKRASS